MRTKVNGWAAGKETAPAGGRRAGAVLGSVHSPATGTRLSQEFQGTKGSNRFRGAYLQAMPGKPIELPPTVAKAFVRDMRAFFAAPNTLKQDEIAARQLQTGGCHNEFAAHRAWGETNSKTAVSCRA